MLRTLVLYSPVIAQVLGWKRCRRSTRFAGRGLHQSGFLVQRRRFALPRHRCLLIDNNHHPEPVPQSRPTGSVDSGELGRATPRLQLINIFIPKNSFASLSNKLFDVLAEAVMRVIKFVVKLAPIGVFAMTASAAGTMGFEERGRLQGYFIQYIVAVLILGLGILPSLIASLTPFKYRNAISIACSAMVLSFAAAKVLVALPLIIEIIKELIEKYEVKDPNAVAEILVPIFYPFPNTGKLLSLFFIPFAAWFVGSPLGFGGYPAFLISGLLSYFGNVAVAMPFLLDLMRIPADIFQLFLLTGVYCGRMSDALGAMDMFTFATPGAIRGLE